MATEVVVTRRAAGRREAVADAAPPRRRRRYLYEASPWRRGDFLRALLLAALGVLIAVICWYQVSGHVRLRDQQGWVVGSVLGLVVACLGAVSWLLVGLRAVRLGQRQLLTDIAVVMDWPADLAGYEGRRKAAAGSDPDALVSGGGMTLVHRANCQVARGKDVGPVAQGHGLDACGMCLPAGVPA
ncbi:MAG TPA: hypothetical protein VE081_08910 [Sporichthyaceae bacterium]|nr:hypothetical protein [Sporichthyaceae bacterium]